ncbi:MAG TPA: TM2 domain-containing protein [Stenomitos sp.]
MTNSTSDLSSKKIAAGICGILLGAFGVHKFILGYTQEGLIMLLVCLLGGIVTCGLSSFVMGVIGLVEGIVYLTKTDSEFESIYVMNKKGWF